MDEDFDFTATAPVAYESSKTNPPHQVDAPTSTAAILASNRLNLVMNGIDNDSVSTLGNPMSPTKAAPPTAPPMIDMTSPQSVSSITSGITLVSRVSAIESQISTMQDTVVAGVDAKLEAFFNKFMAAQSASQLPGGESAGKANE